MLSYNSGANPGSHRVKHPTVCLAGLVPASANTSRRHVVERMQVMAVRGGVKGSQTVVLVACVDRDDAAVPPSAHVGQL